MSKQNRQYKQLTQEERLENNATLSHSLQQKTVQFHYNDNRSDPE